MQAPLVSIIIPHYNGTDLLRRCLRALQLTEYEPVEILVVDNASTDGSGETAKEEFPQIKLIREMTNHGFAGGCNIGMREASGKYVVLLNNDAVVTPAWLRHLVRAAEDDPKIGALQPKILGYSQSSHFDYAGAAGGFMDVLGYPFARGRIFFTLEADSGQYERESNIFWATGTCTLLRRSAVERVGELDETFFAHMEEIDLDWRLHMAGYRVAYDPKSVVHHDAGTTLPPESPRKIYLNHRNGLMMLLKNYSSGMLSWVMPVRLGLEMVSAVYFLLKNEPVQTRSILAALVGVLRETNYIRKARRKAQAIRVIPDREVRQRMYRGSIVWQYFVRGRKTFPVVRGDKGESPTGSRIEGARCPLCDSMRGEMLLEVPDRFHLESNVLHTLVRCLDCRHIFLHPTPSNQRSPYSHDDYLPFVSTSPQVSLTAAFYRALRSLNNVWKRRRIERFARARGTLLDVGCGTGEFLREMREAGWKVKGVEPDQRAAAFGRERFGLDVLSEPQWESMSDSFDVITLWHALEHMETPSRTLASLHARLKPSGLLALAVPNAESVDARFYGSDWVAYDAPRHLHHFTPESIQRLCRDSGFRLLHAGALHLDSPFNALMSESIRWRRRGSGFIGRALGFLRGVVVAKAAFLAGVVSRGDSARYSGSTIVTIWERRD
jgi:GT2 family glycosyltransferase/2-polyprenyl-3-methyl-5-hydroxy-6-metoxy-1,4-benzoquinol methylase